MVICNWRILQPQPSGARFKVLKNLSKPKKWNEIGDLIFLSKLIDKNDVPQSHRFSRPGWTKHHLIVRLQSRSSKECGVPLHCNYIWIYIDTERWYMLPSHLLIKSISLFLTDWFLRLFVQGWQISCKLKQKTTPLSLFRFSL